MYKHQIALFLLTIILVCWTPDVVDSRGGRGGGGRGGGFRSSSSSRSRYSGGSGGYSGGSGYFGNRYSPANRYRSSPIGWKTAAVAGGGVFMGYYFASKFGHRYNHYNNYYSNSICYNVLFSGPNNQPIVNVTDLNNIESLSSEEDILKIPPTPSPSTEATKTNSSRGLFLCPLTYEQISKSYCCGPDNAEYCCSYWETGEPKIYLLILLVFIIFAVCLVRRLRRRNLTRFCHSKNQNDNINMQQQQQQGVMYFPEGQPLTGPPLQPHQPPPMGYPDAPMLPMPNDGNAYPMPMPNPAGGYSMPPPVDYMDNNKPPAYPGWNPNVLPGGPMDLNPTGQPPPPPPSYNDAVRM